MNTFSVSVILGKYYNNLYEEYKQYPIMQRIFFAYNGFNKSDIIKFLAKEYRIHSREFYLQEWKHGICLIVFKTLTSVEYFFHSEIDLLQYIPFLIKDYNFKKLVFSMFAIDEIFR